MFLATSIPSIYDLYLRGELQIRLCRACLVKLSRAGKRQPNLVKVGCRLQKLVCLRRPLVGMLQGQSFTTAAAPFHKLEHHEA
jgi:hypothetical protein